jgi:RsiW-degrading membrane proteinase PrsW (M82 family)
MSANLQLLTSIFFAFLSGMIPSLIWLFFWTREDKKNPEPISMLALAFIGGMVAVFISLFSEKYLYGLGLQKLFSDIFGGVLPLFEKISSQTGVQIEKVLLVIIFAPFIEEVSKFVMAYILVLKSKYDDEPLDPMIYMITTALGFAAVENMLFLINPFQNHDIVLTIFTGNMRFIGATLLHTISSAMIGLFMSFSFFNRSKLKKGLFTILGIVSSIILHSVFNFLMIGNQNSSTLALELIWIIVIILLLAFEKIKKIRLENIC